jgi:hypothetical protein
MSDVVEEASDGQVMGVDLPKAAWPRRPKDRIGPSAGAIPYWYSTVTVAIEGFTSG